MGLLDRITSSSAPVPKSIDGGVEAPDNGAAPDGQVEPNGQHEVALKNGAAKPAEDGSFRLMVRRFQIGRAKEDPFRSIRERVQTQLIRESNRYLKLDDREAVNRHIVTMLDEALTQEQIQPARVDYMRILESIANEVLGFGPIQPLLDDDTVTEVMVNGFDQVFVERFGRLHLTDVSFDDDDHVMRIIDKIVSPIGRRVDESSPMVDARLPDGSRVNAIVPPLSLVGPILTVRRFPQRPLMADDLVQLNTWTADMRDFLDAAVHARLNCLISGGTGSGKTTLLNVLSAFIPDTERIITVEDAAELQLVQKHVVTLEGRPPNIDGRGEITIRDLVRNCLRMRPDRIIVGEVRSGEALDMLQAMNTGHDGSLTTTHANTPRDALARIETMVLMAGMDLPVRAIREQVAKAINLIIHEERLQDGTRKITHISEVQGMESDTIVLEDIFIFEQTGYESNRVIGSFRATGARPRCFDKFQAMGVQLPSSVFGRVLLNP